MAFSAGLVHQPKALPQKREERKQMWVKIQNTLNSVLPFKPQVTFHTQALPLLTLPIHTRFLWCSEAAFVFIAEVSRALRCEMQTVKNHINLALISEGRSQQKSGHHTDRCCCEKELPSFIYFFFFSNCFSKISLGFRTSILGNWEMSL